ncbi:metallophosphoesterase family protein [Candidatus Woesearchaeota archaeon]|nr:metallophosphoesterase family protein [Candidatus Woesearchaeota archaeon]
MKLFTFTDTHGSKKIILELIKKIKKANPNLIICSGDLTNFGIGLKKILKEFEKLNTPLLIIPGNHETNSELTAACKKTKFAVNVHKKIYSINDYLFFGFGLGGFQSKNIELEKLISKIKKVSIGKKFIFVTHQPPYNTELDKMPNGHAGSISARKFIKKIKPIMCICGHLHENENKFDKIGKTLIINPGNKGKQININ